MLVLRSQNQKIEDEGFRVQTINITMNNSFEYIK